MDLQRVAGRIQLISLISLPVPERLIAVTKTSRKESSLRITLPKEVVEKLDIS